MLNVILIIFENNNDDNDRVSMKSTSEKAIPIEMINEKKICKMIISVFSCLKIGEKY